MTPTPLQLDGSFLLYTVTVNVQNLKAITSTDCLQQYQMINLLFHFKDMDLGHPVLGFSTDGVDLHVNRLKKGQTHRNSKTKYKAHRIHRHLVF